MTKEPKKKIKVKKGNENGHEGIKCNLKREAPDLHDQEPVNKKTKRVKKKSTANPNDGSIPIKKSSSNKNSENHDDSIISPDKSNKKADKRKERKQKKKEKRALLKEQNHIHEGKGQGKAIRYLDAWQSQHDGKESSWKFEKCRQIWLLNNAYDDTKVPDAKFDSLLRYMATIKGGSREMTIATALRKVEMGEQAEKSTTTNDGGSLAESKENVPEGTESKENVPESTDKQPKRKSKKKKKKKEHPKEEPLSATKVLQRASDIIEMLDGLKEKAQEIQ